MSYLKVGLRIVYDTTYLNHYFMVTWCLSSIELLGGIFSDPIKNTVKPVLSGFSKGRPKIGFRGRLSLSAGQKYWRMLQEKFCNSFDLSYATICLQDLCFLFIFERPLKTGFTV